MSTPIVKQSSFSRTTPFLARIKERHLLSKEGATKEVYHITLCIKDSGLRYTPGDAIGVLPQNSPAQIENYLTALGLKGEESLTCPRTKQDLTARTFFQKSVNLSRLTTKLAHAIAPNHTNDTSLAPLELLRKATTPPPLDTLAPHFAPMLPRFYSIASSMSAFPDEIHLTVAVPSFIVDGVKRYGLASSFLCHAATPEPPIPLYIQSASHFALPQDTTKPLIMIGPGTGIAPFRAFIQERVAQGASGKHWLFFGDRNRKTDFYYEEEWNQYAQEGHLRLDLAFSRDQEHKIYVQDRLQENAQEVWQWIDQGATIYVCGDAKTMAKAVQSTLLGIIHTQGKQEDAPAFLKTLRKEKRYLTDVY